MPSSGQLYGLSILQQGAEDIAKAREEAKKAEADAIGNRKLYDIAVKSGALDLDQQIEYNKGNAQAKDRIIAGAMRGWQAQREQEQDQMRKQAFALDQARFANEQARAKWTPPPEAVAAAEKSRQQYIPMGPGQFTMAPLPRPTPTEEQMAQIRSEASKVGGDVIPMPDGTFRFERKPAPSAPPTPTVNVPGVGPLPATHPAAEARIKELDPSTQIHQTFGAKPVDFMPGNVTVGVKAPDNMGGGFYSEGDIAKAKSHVKLNNTGTVMTTGDYTKWLNQLADAGQLDVAVKHPVTGQTITPTKQRQIATNPMELSYDDPRSIAIVQGFLDKAKGDPDVARQLAEQQRYIWPH